MESIRFSFREMDEATRLEKEYCPPVDPALFFALVLEHDLEDADSTRELRSKLEIIKASAESEDTRDFDPSGSSRVISSEEAHAGSSSISGLQSSHGSTTHTTDMASLVPSLTSTSISNASHEDTSSTKDDEDFETMSAAEKEDFLQAMFPDLTALEIQLTLKRGGRLINVVDVLLDQYFLNLGYDSEGEKASIPRGVDGFMVEDDSGIRHSKRKGKKRSKARSSTDGSRPSSATATPVVTDNRWDRASKDIAYITSRTGLSAGIVQSAYHASHASLATTIRSLCQTHAQSSSSTDPEKPTFAVIATELSAIFPNLSYATLSAILQLTHLSVDGAADLASILSTSPTPPPTAQAFLPPPAVSSPPNPFTVITPRHSRTSSSHQPSTTSLSTLRATHAATLTAATAAYRRARSQPQHRAAAAHYASLATDAGRLARQHASALADAHVARQSTSGELDLHGVGVADAVRLAGQRAHAWWDAGAAEWAREGKADWGGGGGGKNGLRVVVGKGKHSVGGKAKLGPAVEKALRAEGWKVEVEQGVLVVVGRKR